MAIRKSTDLIVVHVTATKPSTPCGVKEVTRMHKARGFSTIGYHYVIRRDGTVETGRPENEIGAHVQGFNSNSVGISLEGGLDEFTGQPADTRTQAQSQALIKLIKELLTRYPKAKVCGHRDLSPDRNSNGVIEPYEYIKACPCFDAIPWAIQNGLPAASIKGVWSDSKKETVVLADNLPAPDAKPLELQTLLKRAGYEFGPLDGIIGPKTIAAVKRFQTAAGIPASGKFDADTVSRLRKINNAPIFKALMDDDTLKVVPPAAALGIKDLRKLGSRTIKSADFGQVLSGLTAVSAVVKSATEVVTQVKDTSASINDVVSGVVNAATNSPGSFTAVLAASAIYFAFQQIKKARVEDHNKGVNIGRRDKSEFLSLNPEDLK